MKRGRFYMHKKMMDVCIKIVAERGKSKWVQYWNLGYVGNPYILDPAPYKIIIPTKDEKNYKWIPEIKLYQKRTKAGPP